MICEHLSPKQMLDKMRFLCKGKTEPIPDLYRQFNRETHDGRDMSVYSELLGDAIASIVEVKEESDISSFLGGEQISFLSNEIKGLDDFELICFLVVKKPVSKSKNSKEYRVIIAGNRDFEDYDFVSRTLDAILPLKTKKVIIVSGTSRGADRLGERYAMERKLSLEKYPADWEYFGKAAGPKRNMQMAKIADAVIAFWDGESCGTQSMIGCAKGENIPCTVIRI